MATTQKLVLHAEIGWNTATMSGWVDIVSNDQAGYGQPRFKFIVALGGSIVASGAIYIWGNGVVWDENTYDRMFDDQFSVY